MREKDFFRSSACHNSFAGLPRNWSLRGMLMLRESGRFGLTAPPSRGRVSLLNRRRTAVGATERARKKHLLVRQIRGDSQSDQFK